MCRIFFYCLLTLNMFFFIRAMLQSPKTARQMPGLTNHHCIVLHKLALLLIFLFQIKGILSMLTVKVNWSHLSLPRQCHYMGKTHHFLVCVLQLLVVPPLLLLQRLAVLSTRILFMYYFI